MDKIALPLDGTCRCGATRFRITTAPMMTAACHCTGCQRMASSAFSLTAMVQADGFEVLEGAPVLGGVRNPDLQHSFCPECLTWIFTRVPEHGMVNVRPTMFDDLSWFAPFIETCTKAKLPWAQTGAAHSFEAFPPMERFGELIAEYTQSRG